jgi:hypothetical protein
MIRFFLIAIMLNFDLVIAQNLIPNPSFETFTNCPSNIGGLGDFNLALPWFRANGSPDYFNACDTLINNLSTPTNAFGNQPTRTGVAYGGFYSFNAGFPNLAKEYIEVKLLDTLSTAVTYRLQFYLSLSDFMKYATNSIGAYFSSQAIVNNSAGAFYFTPQVKNNSNNSLTDKTNWMLVEDTFTAVGNEAYMMIGNFFPDSLSDTTYVGGSGWGVGAAYYYIDDVSLTLFDTGVGLKQNTNSTQINIYPNPANETINLKGPTKAKGKLELMDMQGRPVFAQNFKDGQGTWDITLLQPGIYFYKISSCDKIELGKLIVIEQ